MLVTAVEWALGQDLAGCAVARQALIVGRHWCTQLLAMAKGSVLLSVVRGTESLLLVATAMSERHLCRRQNAEDSWLVQGEKTKGKYETAQLFLHTVLGHRGIVCFPVQPDCMTGMWLL
jgi:hypothetical protein